jgi:hypothetical protein
MRCGGIINYLFKIGDKILTKSILAGILSIIALIVISSCGDNGTSPSVDGEIWPLKVGNYWKFDVFGYDTLGNVSGTGSATYSIVSDTMINNEKFYKMNVEIDDETEDPAWLTNRADGVYSYELKQIEIIIKYPATKGEKFDAKGGITTLENTNYNYETTIGNFSCYQYTILSSYHKDIVYFKPGVGHVAEEMFRNTESSRLYLAYKLVLKEYKVN